MAQTNKGISTGTAVAAGATAAAAAAAAVGAYWFYGSNDAEKHRKSARSWMLQARGDVLKAVETAIDKVGEIDKATYMSIVEGVLARYSSASGATQKELLQATRDMQAAWQHMQKVRKASHAKKPKRAAPRPAVKKVGKKTQAKKKAS